MPTSPPTVSATPMTWSSRRTGRPTSASSASTSWAGPITSSPMSSRQHRRHLGVVASGLSFPNGMVITPDGKTLIVNELFGNKITAFDIGADGKLANKRDFANFGEIGDEPDVAKRIEAATIVPDGLALDAEGAVWIANTVNQNATRIAEGGQILDTVDTAPEGIFAVALGGDDGKTLFLCAAPDWDEGARSKAREGRMLATTVAVPHAGRP
uniref:Lactonohydrolase n=1 Tax=Brevibacterium sp. HCU TaxID=133406 RepID=Q8VW46_9MICO|nr:lactonohydrolase [Brevibacterium sp. HCU]